MTQVLLDIVLTIIFVSLVRGGRTAAVNTGLYWKVTSVNL